MVTWQVLPNGLETEVTFEGEDNEAWKEFQTKELGVAGQRELPMSWRKTIHTEKERESAIIRRRYMSLPETYYAVNSSILPFDQSLLELWEQFKRSSATFAKNLAINHHYRQLGWNLKSGLNYGAHYVLYQGSAACFHSEYIVYVQDEDKAMSWNTIQSLTRIATDVKKTVLILTVTAATMLNQEGNTIAPDTNLTFGVYKFHDIQYTVEAIAIRYWDASLADEPQSYKFQQLSVLPKRIKPARTKNKAKSYIGDKSAAVSQGST